MKLELLLSEVECQLRMLLEELESAGNRLRNDVSGIPSRPDEPDFQGLMDNPKWTRDLEEFQIRAAAVRRILGRFGTSDRGTRFFMQSHIDDEWNLLSQSYDKLRKEFAEARHRNRGSRSDVSGEFRPR